MAILIIAEKGFHKLYRSFSSKENQLFECTPRQSEKFIKTCEADLILLDCGSDVGNGLRLLKDIKIRYPEYLLSFLPRLVPKTRYWRLLSQEHVISSGSLSTSLNSRKPLMASSLPRSQRGRTGVLQDCRHSQDRPAQEADNKSPRSFNPCYQLYWR